MGKPRQQYDERARNFLLAMDIGEEVRRMFLESHLTEDQRKQDADQASELREHVLNPEPQFRNCASLKYLEDAFFTFWHEGAGPAVEEFWRRVEVSGLPYERRNYLRAVLDRGRIQSRTEYDALVDGIVVFEQEGRITAQEAQVLSECIGEYENRRARQNRAVK